VGHIHTAADRTYREVPMRAVTVIPGSPGSARLEEVPEPGPSLGSVLVEAIAVGVCGTDVEIASGEYGWVPPGRERLILGHESLGRVIDPVRAGSPGRDHVVGIVRRPDPVPCPNCAVGEWDMWANGAYTERGIKQVDGFMSDRWRIEPEYAVKVDTSLGVLGVLLEPTTGDHLPHRSRATCDTRLQRADDTRERRGAQEPGAVRVRQRQPPPLLSRRASAGQSGQVVA
jgi:threonine dehydrogenase-like Zn-dependent dehydrogenase